MTFSPSQTYNLSVPGCGDAQCREAAAEPDGGVAAPNDVDGGRVHEPHGRGRAGEAKGKVHQRTECAHTPPTSHTATMSACGTHRPLPTPAHREAPELQTEHAGAAQAQVQGREPGGWADHQGALEEEHRAGDEASVSMGPARRLLLMALLPATLHKVLGEGDSNTLLNERRWWPGAHVCASGSRAADPRRASRWWPHLGHVVRGVRLLV